MKILLLVHTDLIPPEEIDDKAIDRFNTPWITEYDVKKALIKLGHEVHFCGIYDDIAPLLKDIQTFRPNIVFNLLEEFNGNTRMDYNIVSLLELMNISYTGCCSKGLLLAKDKAIAKKILRHHHIGTPHFFVMPKSGKKKIPKNLKFPLIVKCLYEEASYGLAKASVVQTQEKLLERIQYIHKKLEQDAIIEEFVPGTELFVGIAGNKQLKNYPIWELAYENVEEPEMEFYTERAKWNKDYRERKGIVSRPAKLSSELEIKIIQTCKKVYQLLNLSGYARIDLRLTAEGQIYILEANPNPNIAKDDEFALSAKELGIKYSELIQSLLNLA